MEEPVAPRIPDYAAAFSHALRERLVPSAQIEIFVRVWNSLPSGASKLPCPICYAAGGWGALNPIPATRDGSEFVTCARCKNEIAVNGSV
jgi:hypothetical protein